jgi:drug/metabolite transporter (DMT)-like permease
LNPGHDTPSRSAAGASWPFLLTAVVLWASAFPAIRRSVEVLSPGELVIGRLLVASTGLALLMAPRLRRRGIPPAADLRRLFIVGILGVSGYQLLLNTGAQTVSAATAAVLVNLAPVVAALFAPAFVGERLSRRRWIGVALAFAGSVLVATTEGGGFSVSWGALAVFGSAMSAGFFILRQKPLLEDYDPLEVTGWATILATVPALVFLPGFLSTMNTPQGAEIWPYLMWLGIGSSVFGYGLWAVGLHRTEATRASMWLYLVPPSAAIMAWWWLGEPLTTALVAGAAVSLVGVRLATAAR